MNYYNINYILSGMSLGICISNLLQHNYSLSLIALCGAIINLTLGLAVSHINNLVDKK